MNKRFLFLLFVPVFVAVLAFIAITSLNGVSGSFTMLLTADLGKGELDAEMAKSAAEYYSMRNDDLLLFDVGGGIVCPQDDYRSICDAVTMGRGDSEEAISALKVSCVISNQTAAQREKYNFITDSIVFNCHGIKIGVFGLQYTEDKEAALAAAKTELELLKNKKTDVIVALIYDGALVADELAAQTDGLDVILEGGADAGSRMVDGTLITAANMNTLGVVNVTLTHGNVIEKKAELLDAAYCNEKF